MTIQFILTEELNPLEHLLQVIVDLINWSYRFIDRVAGLIGIVVLMPLFALVSFALWLALKVSNWRLNYLVKALFRQISNATPRDVMLYHHAIKNRRWAADQMILKLQPTSSFFLFSPLFGQVKKSRGILVRAEERLHKTAYPQFYQPLTHEQKAELQRLSTNLEGIWEDSDSLLSK